MAGSKLTPALLDRILGSPVTARNWNTVQKLAEMASVWPRLDHVTAMASSSLQ